MRHQSNSSAAGSAKQRVVLTNEYLNSQQHQYGWVLYELFKDFSEDFDLIDVGLTLIDVVDFYVQNTDGGGKLDKLTGDSVSVRKRLIQILFKSAILFQSDRVEQEILPDLPEFEMECPL